MCWDHFRGKIQRSRRKTLAKTKLARIPVLGKAKMEFQDGRKKVVMVTEIKFIAKPRSGTAVHVSGFVINDPETRFSDEPVDGLFQTFSDLRRALMGALGVNGLTVFNPETWQQLLALREAEQRAVAERKERERLERNLQYRRPHRPSRRKFSHEST